MLLEPAAFGRLGQPAAIRRRHDRRVAEALEPADCQPRGLSWEVTAACRSVDPELFFPERRTRRWDDQTETALAVCDHCEVRTQCLLLALQLDTPYGVWGGMTAGERKRVKRRLAKRGSAKSRMDADARLL